MLKSSGKEKRRWWLSTVSEEALTHGITQSQVLNRDLKVVLYDFAGAGRSPVPDEVSIQLI